MKTPREALKEIDRITKLSDQTMYKLTYLTICDYLSIIEEEFKVIDIIKKCVSLKDITPEEEQKLEEWINNAISEEQFNDLFKKNRGNK